jgi:hypothetical protein
METPLTQFILHSPAFIPTIIKNRNNKNLGFTN